MGSRVVIKVILHYGFTRIILSIITDKFRIYLFIYKKISKTKDSKPQSPLLIIYKKDLLILKVWTVLPYQLHQPMIYMKNFSFLVQEIVEIFQEK